MKKIVWISFAVLALVWTGFIALSLAIVDWVLAAVSSTQVSSDMVLAPWPLPSWLVPWLDPAWLYAIQTGLVAGIEGLNRILRGAMAVGGWIAALGWIVWGLGMAALVILAVVLHKVGSARQRARGNPAGMPPR